MTLNDAHCHFFSAPFFEALGREKHPGRDVSAGEMSTALGWEAPAEAEALADRWVAELDQHKVARAALIASVPGDEPSVAAAVARHPRRFVGFFTLNASAPDAAARAEHAFGALGLRCACLYPAMHRYPLSDPRVAEIFAVAATHHAALFVHCGYLSVEARTKLGLPNGFDLRYGDPLALAATASRYPEVPVIVPHFGAGFFRETLMAAEMCRSLCLDTSSSNSWLKYVPGLSLAEVFRIALAIVGPDRLLFGTDSSYFPRGWRRVILGAQRTALDELGVEDALVRKILGENFDRILPDQP